MMNLSMILLLVLWFSRLKLRVILTRASQVNLRTFIRKYLSILKFASSVSLQPFFILEFFSYSFDPDDVFL